MQMILRVVNPKLCSSLSVLGLSVNALRFTAQSPTRRFFGTELLIRSMASSTDSRNNGGVASEQPVKNSSSASNPKVDRLQGVLHSDSSTGNLCTKFLLLFLFSLREKIVTLLNLDSFYFYTQI